MTRRALLAALTGAALDPERLLWRPGKKLISIPKPRPVVRAYQLSVLVEVDWATGPDETATFTWSDGTKETIIMRMPTFRAFRSDGKDPLCFGGAAA